MSFFSFVGARFAVAFLSSLATSANAGPDEVTDRLMLESASLFDVGMLRLELRLQRLTQSENIPPAFAYYNWDNNEIVIWSSVFDDTWTPERATEACDAWFTEVRRMAGIDAETGKLYSAFPRSAFADLFNHVGFHRTIDGKPTSEIVTALDSKFNLTFSWFTGDSSSGFDKQLSCSGALIEKGYSVKVENAD